MILRMSQNYTAELNEFLFTHNQMKDYFIAWIPESRSEITALDKTSFLLCVENGSIVGCMGASVSLEQGCARLLGPVIERAYFASYADLLYKTFLSDLPPEIREIRIAFLEDNILCRQWCEAHAFELYNAEITMVLQASGITGHPVSSKAELTFYDPKHKDGLARVHPAGTFFTLEELVAEISDCHHLLLAVYEGEVVGYVYYEQSDVNKSGEIQLLHVRADKRCLGFGSHLLNRALLNLTNDGIGLIATSVRTANGRAHQLYKRMGFYDRETIYAYKKML